MFERTPQRFARRTARTLSLPAHVPKRPMEMDAPAEQTMREPTHPDRPYEIGLCEFWKEPGAFLCSAICPCVVYGVTVVNLQKSNQKPKTVGCLDVLRPSEPCLRSVPLFALPCCCCGAVCVRQGIRSEFYLNVSGDDVAKDCLAYSFLPWCAVYQDYAEVKLRMDRRWAEDHPSGNGTTA